jgi:hypothetical protein
MGDWVHQKGGDASPGVINFIAFESISQQLEVKRRIGHDL